MKHYLNTDEIISYLSKFYPIEEIHHQINMENLIIILKYGLLKNSDVNPYRRQQVLFDQEFPNQYDKEFDCKRSRFFYGSSKPFLEMNSFQNHFDGMITFLPPKETIVFKSVSLDRTLEDREYRTITGRLVKFYSDYYKLNPEDRKRIEGSLDAEVYRMEYHIEYDYHIYIREDCRIELPSIKQIYMYSEDKYNRFKDLLDRKGLSEFLPKVIVKSVPFYNPPDN